mmetsp:Transcript_10632/g.16838  ORF Transcript_10632/g.16838 Transcript_10632/m.16838 type:complete len:138 (-) Transcript_10632:129-542(-)
MESLHHRAQFQMMLLSRKGADAQGSQRTRRRGMSQLESRAGAPAKRRVDENQESRCWCAGCRALHFVIWEVGCILVTRIGAQKGLGGGGYEELFIMPKHIMILISHKHTTHMHTPRKYLHREMCVGASVFVYVCTFL